MDITKEINEEPYRAPVTRPTVTISEEIGNIKCKHGPLLVAARKIGNIGKIDAADFLKKEFHIPDQNKTYFKYIPEEGEKKEMRITVKNLSEQVINNVVVFFNKNFVITKPRGFKEAYPDKFELPEDISAEENKFGAFCRAITSIYMRECGKADNFVLPIGKYVDQKTHKATVHFSDGTDVSCEPMGDDLHLAVKTNDYFAQDICYAKKILGGTSAIRKCLEKCDYAARKKEIRQLNKELYRKLKEENLRFEKEDFEYEVKEKMKRLRIEREANRRLDIEEARKAKKSQE